MTNKKPLTAAEIRALEIEQFVANAKPKDKGLGGHVKDSALSLLSGAVSVPEAAVGVADLVTGGRAGKFLENEDGAVGFRPKEAHEAINSWKTEGAQKQLQQFQNTEGLGGKFGYALKNRSMITNAVLESLPAMGAGGVVGRGLGLAAKGIKPVAAAAVGEGVVGAGMTAEAIRQETPDGLLTPKQAALAGASGVTTGGFGYLGGKAAQKLGIADPDTMFTTGNRFAGGVNGASSAPQRNIVARTAGGAATEGIFEELPQSVSEQMLQNVALGKDAWEGTADAAVLGVLSGGLMGGVSGAATRPNQAPPTLTDEERGITPTEDADGTPWVDNPRGGGSPVGGLPNPAGAPRLGYGGRPTDQMNVDPHGNAFKGEDYNDYLAQQQADARANRQGSFVDVTPVPQGYDSTSDAYTDQTQAAPQAPTPTTSKPSESMGLNPNDGPLSTAAVIAVDSGASPAATPAPIDVTPVEQGQPLTNAAGATNKTPIVDSKKATSKAYTLNHKEVPYQWDVVDADDLITSHTNNFGINPNFPSELQPRKRERSAYQAQVLDIENRLRPEWLGDSTLVSQGSPFIGRSDNIVESGNGRSIGIRRAYESGKADHYKKHIQDSAADYGLDPSEVAKINKPVLVRRNLSDLDRAEFAHEANDPETAQLSAAERAIADVKKLPSRELLEVDNKGNIDLANSNKFTQQFINNVSTNEATNLIAANGELSQTGQNRIAGALLHDAYGSDRLTEAVTETLDGSAKNLLKALTNKAPQISQLNEQVAQGNRTANTLSQDITAAAETYIDMVESRANIDDYINNHNIFGEDIKPEVREIIKDIHNNSRSTSKIGASLQARIDAANRDGNPEYLGFDFGESPNVGTEAPATDSATTKTLNEAVPYPAIDLNAPQAMRSDSGKPLKMPENDTVKQQQAQLDKIEADLAKRNAEREALEASLLNKDGSKKWFTSAKNAEAFIDKKKINRTHTVVPTKVKGITRYEIHSKRGDDPKPQPQSQQPKKELTVGSTVTSIVNDKDYKVTGIDFNDAGGVKSVSVQHIPKSDSPLAGKQVGSVKKSIADFVRMFGGSDKTGEIITPYMSKQEESTSNNLKPQPKPVDLKTTDYGVADIDTRSDADAIVADLAATETKDKAKDKAAKTLIGKNKDGDPLYEDGRGVRSILEFGSIYNTEKVGVNPDGIEQSRPRQDRYLTTEELVEKNNSSAAAIENNKPPKPTTDERIKAADKELKALYAELDDVVEKGDIDRARQINKSINEKDEEISRLRVQAINERPKANTSDDTPTKEAVDENPNDATPAKPEAVKPKADNENQERAPTVREPRGDTQPEVAPRDNPNLETKQPTDGSATTESESAGRSSVRATGKNVADDGGVPEQRNAPNGREGASDQRPPNAGAGERTTTATNDVKSPAATAATATDLLIENPLEIVGGTPVERFNRNRKALELMQTLYDEARQATPDEQRVLAGYIGWGSFGQELFQGSWENPKYRDEGVWKERGEWLRETLGESAWKSAQRSITNAHYTDPPTVMAMWSMLERMGFKGGRVLEPSMGTGNFFSMMPATIKARSQLTGIELDEATGAIAKQLFPQSNIQIMGYQDSKTPDNFYDVVVGNYPFENTPVADRRYNKLNPMLHDYFFLKSIDQVRAGGLVISITSSGTMDKKNTLIRRELAKKAELVAAIRLPSGAFKDYAGTAVVTDIVILRKRQEKLAMVSNDDTWVNVADYKTPSGENITLNQYYIDNPQNIIGTIDYERGGTRFGGMTVHRPADMEKALKNAISLVPKDAIAPANVTSYLTYYANETGERHGSLFEDKNGELMIAFGDQTAKAQDVVKYAVKSQQTTDERVAQIKAAIDLRRKHSALVDAERADKPAEDQRLALKNAYDNFVKNYGSLRDSYALQYMKRADDPFYLELAALEQDDGTPTAIMTKSTTRGKTSIKNPSVRDAYVLARNQNVNPTLKDIAQIAGKPESEVKAELQATKAIFEAPNGDIVPSDIYLSGNVRQKLREAKAALDDGNKAMKDNVAALEKIIPEDIPYFNIETKLGATWIPPEVYQNFIAHMLGKNDTSGIDVAFLSGRWRVRVEKGLNHSVNARTNYGTEHYSFGLLTQAAFSNQTLRITKKVDGEDVYDGEATAEVNGRIAKMREDFSEWLWSDAERRVDMEKEYNEARNAWATPSYDGTFLSFEGMALTLGNGPFNLREHQANAIWRAIVNRRSLNAHEVGTGKTFTMGGIAIESRRYGIAKKPVIFAHNANSAAVAAEIRMMYPNARVLYVNNLEPKVRDIRLRQIANDDWDAIILPHSLLDRMALTEDTLMDMAADQIAALEQEFRDAAHDDGVDVSKVDLDDDKSIGKIRSQSAKELAKARKRIIESIKKQAQQASRAGAVTFEDLGIDMILVDEVHEFKKPPIVTRMTMKGLNTQTSQRSIQLQFLTKYVRQMNNGGNVHTFTGTPITNTITEIYHQMRYIMDSEMQESSVSDWDGWFGSFATEVQDVELSSAGDYEMVTRLAGFVNVPELRQMIGQYMDTVFAEDMPEMKPRKTKSGKTLSDNLTEIEKAELLNGRTEGAKDRPYKKVVNESADMTAEQKHIFNKVQSYAAEWRDADPKTRREWQLKGDHRSPIVYGRLADTASFDARMLDPNMVGMEGKAPLDKNSKTSRVVKNVVDIFNQHELANQVIFMDNGYSTKVKRSGGRDDKGEKLPDITVPIFSPVLDLVERLVQSGIPREKIAVVTGSTSKEKRSEIAASMNSGDIRVVIGSTQTLGVGVNMQRNLRAMHHMDAPYMPGELEQRNGRGQRQGNQWNTVLEYRYMTDRLDGKRWQILAVKQRFINAFMKSKGNTRTIEGDAIEEKDDILESFSEAAGDPRILQRVKLNNKIEQLHSKERLYVNGIADMRRSIRTEKLKLSQNEQRLSEIDLNAISDLLAGQKESFKATLGSQSFDKRVDASKALDAYIKENVRLGDKLTRIGTYGGLPLSVTFDNGSTEPLLVLKVGGETFAGKGFSGIEAKMRNINNTVGSLERSIEDSKSTINNLEKAVEQPFTRKDELKRLEKQLKELELDLSLNPIPAPVWLRQGAPMDSEIYYGGKPFVVTGHKYSKDGYFVTAEDDKGVVVIPYLEAKDAVGMDLYDEQEFILPEVIPQKTNADEKQPIAPSVDKPSNITISDIQNTFDFKEVVGDPSKPLTAEQQEIANSVHGALSQLADILGVPNEAISLGGKLSLDIFGGAKQQGLPYFDPNIATIHLNGKLGSIAHEWFHALDNYFTSYRGERKSLNAQDNYISMKPEPQMVFTDVFGSKTFAPKNQLEKILAQQKAESSVPHYKMFDIKNWALDTEHPKGVRPQVEKAFADVVDAFSNNDMGKRSGNLDKNNRSVYWTQTTELAARSFEVYIRQKMKDSGNVNDSLAKDPRLEFEATKLDESHYPYATQEESPAIVEAFENLFKTVEVKDSESGKGKTLYSRKGIKGAVKTTKQQVIDKLSEKFGKPVIDKLIRDGVLEIKTLSDYVVDGKLAIPDDVDGIYHNNKAILIADNLSDDMIIPTFLHELGGHGGLQTLMSDKAYAALMKDFDAMVAAGNPLAVRAKAMADKVSSNQSEANDEYLPYLITLASRESGRQGKLTRLMNRIIMAIKGFLRNKLGVNLKISPQDVVRLAERMVTQRAIEGTQNAILNKEINNIKSATDNVGTFDPHNGDIRYGRRRRYNDPNQLSFDFDTPEAAPTALTKAAPANQPELAATVRDEAEREAWRKKHAVNQRQQRTPSVQEAAKRYQDGEITQDEYIEIVRRDMPIIPMAKVPDVPTLLEVGFALDKNKVETGIVGIDKVIDDDTRVGLRLDIPAYDNYDTWIVSIHDGEKAGGKSLGYAQTGYIKDVEFMTAPKGALNIATGKSNKSTIARMHGDWINHSPYELAEKTKKALRSPDWLEVGMNPFRHSWFYDKADGNPVVSADEVIQIGALVLARNAQKTTVDDDQFTAGKGSGMKFSRSANLDDDFDIVDFSKQAGQRFWDWASAAPAGKLSWWHKTVGTMYNLAQRNPYFKPVYENTEKFINDVSFYAAKASEFAPRLLPKLDGLRDITKSAISTKDNEAISKPIFEGTLIWGRDLDGNAVKVDDWLASQTAQPLQSRVNTLRNAGRFNAQQQARFDRLPSAIRQNAYINNLLKAAVPAGVVWTDSELRQNFNLNDNQIELYREFRATTDSSLDNMARADMLRRLGKEANNIEKEVMEAADLNAATSLIARHIQTMILQDPQKADALNSIMEQVQEAADKTHVLMQNGYAPLSRFGQYTVDVVDADGNREYFGLFESAYEARKMAESMRSAYDDSFKVSQGALSNEEFKMFAGITPETAELFGEMLGLNGTGGRAADKAFQSYLKHTKNNRSALKRLIHRKGIKGFSEDSTRVLASFVYSNARHTSAALNMGNMDRAIEAIPKGEGQLKDAAVRLADYIKNPQDEGYLIRSFMFAQYLGGSIASALVNLTQPIAVSFPYLSQFGGAGKSANELRRASADWASAFANKNRNVFSADLQRAIKEAEDDGILSPQEVHNLLRQARGKNPLRSGDGTAFGDSAALAQNTASRLGLAWGSFFSLAEQANRRITFVAAYRMAVDQGMENPANFARESIKETQFVYNKAARMQWGRGAVGGTLMTFKTYTVSYIELIHRLWTQGEKGSPERAQGRKAALVMLATLFVLSGMGGVPFMEDAEDLIDGAAQVMGYNISSKQHRQAFLDSVFGEMFGEFMESGISGINGAPIDVSGRLGLGNLIPATGLLKERPSNLRDALEVIGPAGDFVSRVGEGTRGILKGAIAGDARTIGRSTLSFMPVAVRNAAIGTDMLNSGMYKDKKGYKVDDVSAIDAAFKFFGFQPNHIAKLQDRTWTARSLADYYNLRAADIRSLWAQGIVEKNPNKIRDAQAALKVWNKNNPTQRIIIRPTDIQRRVREMKMGKEDRVLKHTPKNMREHVRVEFAAATTD